MGDNSSNPKLPPGFHFCPSDEELVVHFLQRKASLLPCHPDIIPDLELCPYDPWDLDGKAMSEGNKWYFFSRRTQDRVTSNGFWQAFGGDEPVISSSGGRRVGIKKYYVYYLGESPDGVKTNWIMQEYRLSDAAGSSSRSSSSKRRGHSKLECSRWVVCRVFEHDHDNDNDNDDDEPELSCLDEIYYKLDDFDEVTFPN